MPRFSLFLSWWSLPFSQEGGAYLIRGTWFPICLPLVGTGSYLDLLGRNWYPMVARVQDPDSSPRAFRRMGGQGRSLDRRHNSYSYVTTGTTTGFGGEAVGLEPPWR
jgi:hypothetical protein